MRHSKSLAALATLMLLGSCSEHPAPPQTAAQAPDAPPHTAPPPAPTAREQTGPRLWSGEHLVAEVTTAGMAVGEYELWVDRPCMAQGRPALPVVSKAQRRGIFAALATSGADAVSWLDAQTGAPLQARSTVVAGDHTKRYLVQFGSDHYDYVYERNSTSGKRRHYRTEKAQPTPAHIPVHDMHSTLSVLRRWSNDIGTRGTLHTVVGRILYRVEVTVAGREQVTAGGTTYDAIRIEGVARRFSQKLKLMKRRRHWTLWLSDEPIRMPVRAQLESRRRTFLAELVRYQEPSYARPASALGPCEGVAAPPQVDHE